jgi:TolB protein
LKPSASLKKLVVAAVIFAASFLQATPQDIDNVGVTGMGLKSVKIAVPELQFTAPSAQTATLAKIFNDTLWNDLEFSGNLEMAPRSFYPAGIFAKPGDIKVEDWTKPGITAQYVVYGGLSLNGTQFSVEGYLRDLGAQQDSIASDFRGAYDEEGARNTAHRFADRILEQLGFGKGIARTQIAFVSSRTGDKEIYVMDYDGNNQRKLTAIRFIAITPNWSPSDDRIAYTAWRPGGGEAQIEIISSSGDRQPFQQPRGYANSIPAWSPDGKSIVYSSNRNGNAEIYLANADGTNPKRLTNSPGIDTSPSINPATGAQIAFISKRSGTAELYVMDSDGTNTIRITEEGGEVGNPAYSPDGKMIAFAWQKPRSGGFNIYLYDVGMRKFTQLTNDSGSNERPTWAPDGKHIAFQSNRTGTTQIFSMILNAPARARQLTNSAGISEGPTWSGFAAR